MAKAEKKIELSPMEVREGEMEVTVLGDPPLVYHAVSIKSAQDLLMPPKKKSRSEKETTLKHNPPEEYIQSTYRRRADEDGPTRLLIPGRMVKAAISAAAIRTPGATGAEVKQLVRVTEIMVDLYGIPEIYMTIVRQTDMKRTPDVRTRAAVRQWCATFTVTYATPQLNPESVLALIANAGRLNGWGDDRLQKGGSFGGFKIVDRDDPRVKALMKSAGMKAQDAALKDPVSFDIETEQMLSWWKAEVKRRDFKIVA